MTRHLAAAILCASTLGACSCDRQGVEPPQVELRLELAKPRWKAGEYLWYRVEIRNAGRGRLDIHDAFWYDQRVLHDNLARQRGLYLEIVREDGSPFEWHMADPVPVPYWTNDISGYSHPSGESSRDRLARALERKMPPLLSNLIFSGARERSARRPPGTVLQLAPGESFVATPSTIKPGSFPEGLSFALLGRRGFESGAPKDYPAGFRILDGRWIEKPGRYRLRAVLRNNLDLPPLSANEEIESLRRRRAQVTGKMDRMLELEAASIRKRWDTLPPERLARLREARAKVERADRSAPKGESEAEPFEVVP